MFSSQKVIVQTAFLLIHKFQVKHQRCISSDFLNLWLNSSNDLAHFQEYCRLGECSIFKNWTHLGKHFEELWQTFQRYLSRFFQSGTTTPFLIKFSVLNLCESHLFRKNFVYTKQIYFSYFWKDVIISRNKNLFLSHKRHYF